MTMVPAFDLASLGFEDEPPVPFAPGPLTGVLFAEDFDGPMVIEAVPEAAPVVLPEPVVVVPSFDKADLDAARREGYAAGLHAAEETAKAARASDRVTALERIAAGLASAGADAAAAVETVLEGTAALLLQMVARTLPTLSAAHGETEIRALMRSLLPALAREPRATIRVHPQHLAAIDAELRELDPADTARIALLATPAMPQGDAAIAWETGGAKREVAAIQAAIEDALAGLGLLAPRTTRHGAECAPAMQPGKQDAGREFAHAN